MTVIAALEAAVILTTVILFLRHLAHAEQAWTQERRELLTRIQRPELVPVLPGGQFAEPDPEIDESALVGSILPYEPEDDQP